MNFAPYQDDNADAEHTDRAPDNSKPFSDSEPQGNLPAPEDFENNVGVPRGGFGNGLGADERHPDVFGTSLPMRLDIEACLAYLALPPAGGAILLLLEHRSDYVRFHAWQSSLVFTLLFVVHLIFSFTKVISFMLLAVDLILIAWLTLQAYRGADSLDRYELPWFGRVASNFVDAE